MTFAQAANNLQQGKSAETKYIFDSVQTAAETFTGMQSGISTTSGTQADPDVPRSSDHSGLVVLGS